MQKEFERIYKESLSLRENTISGEEREKAMRKARNIHNALMDAGLSDIDMEAESFISNQPTESAWYNTIMRGSLENFIDERTDDDWRQYLYESTKVKETRTKHPGRNDQITINFIKNEVINFFEDRGFSEAEHRTQMGPRTFRTYTGHGQSIFTFEVAINGVYEDDILINTVFDSVCGYGYVIQAGTSDGLVEWVGFNKEEFREDLEDVWKNVKVPKVGSDGDITF